MAVVRNFLFHRVNPVRDRLWDPMDVALFDRCVKFIAQKYKVVLIEELALSEELKKGSGYATIMFDDGYKDNLEYAAPILQKYNCKASFYVVTDCIDKNIPTWTHILEHRFQHTQQQPIDLTFSFLPDDLKVTKLNSDEERIAYVNRLKPFLKKLPHPQRNQVLAKVDNAYKNVELPKLMMDWNEVKQLQSAGHYIGSHTVTHCMLGTMGDEAEVKQELLQSAQTIQQRLGHFPLTISYPVGSFNPATKRLSKEVGYKIGLATKQDIYNPAKDDLFEIPRIELYNEPWWKTRLRISNTLEDIKALTGRKKR